MSNGSYNLIFSKVLDEPWPGFNILLWLTILACNNNAEGVFELPLGKLRRLMYDALGQFNISKKATDSAIDAALNELQKVGALKLYRAKSVVWLCKKWKHNKHRNVKNNQIGALRNLREYYPEVLKDFCTMYGLKTDLGVTKFELCGDNVPTDVLYNININKYNTEGECEGETENPSTPLVPTKSPLSSSQQLVELEGLLDERVKLQWVDFAAMVAEARVSKRVAPSVLVKLLRPIVESTLKPEALAYGIEQATKKGAENHTYILKAAASYGKKKIDPVAIQQREPVEFEQDRSGFWVDDDGQAWQGDKMLNASDDEIKTLGERIKEGNLLGGVMDRE